MHYMRYAMHIIFICIWKGGLISLIFCWCCMCVFCFVSLFHMQFTGIKSINIYAPTHLKFNSMLNTICNVFKTYKHNITNMKWILLAIWNKCQTMVLHYKHFYNSISLEWTVDSIDLHSYIEKTMKTENKL